ncbi:cofactor assembly of complex C subunit B [Stenomitos frigidus]|uniref:Cofactor assembly of complex C subunit B n=1 Tax=Stenomitos frigidus ULC18 TaxID=2107698 RepID=A0A2T1DZ88_9CYAN|nr:cofactor assembly of complex C subunit B [Stenomitos frigidus]PSB25751.1 cofactor assembly of complex C subunit B [Stenomitos frigidus ULC18]
MNASVLPSTFVLTLLMSVGLVFFIRASVKDRIEVIRLGSEQSAVALLNQLQAYFTQRAYRLAATDATQLQATFEGVVRPSLLMATFLTLLAAIGFLCLALMLSILFPGFSEALLGLTLLSPVAGLFYWRGAARPEQVVLQVEKEGASEQGTVSIVTVTAHRDELAALQRNLPLTLL